MKGYVFLRLRQRVTWVADACVGIPVVAAVAVLWADSGVTWVRHAAALLHPHLQPLQHVDVARVGGCLAHAHALQNMHEDT